VTISLRHGYGLDKSAFAQATAGQENEDNPPQADRWTFSNSLPGVHFCESNGIDQNLQNT
jgi:hypothetical protein